MAIIGYARVSSIGQDTARQYASLQDCERVFEDHASGAAQDRPGLRQLRDYIRPGDTLRVHSLDRLGRNLEALAGLVRELTAQGVTVEFVSERLAFHPEGATPTATLLLHLLSAFAQFERSMIRARQAEGIEKTKKISPEKYQGRPRSIDRLTVLNLAQSGQSKSQIAKTLGISRTSVYAALSATVKQT